MHEEFVWLHFVDNVPPVYEFIKNSLQVSKEPQTRIVLENTLSSRYNVQSGGKKGIVRVRLEGWTGSWPRKRSRWN